MATLFFFLAIGTTSLSLALMVWSFATKQFQYWPPPCMRCWQFGLFWLLGGVGVASLAALTLVEFQFIAGGRAIVQYAVGGALFLAGGCLAVIAGLQLGIKNTHGAQDGLHTNGLYRWSRNPIYVGVFPWLAGWALIADNIKVATGLVFVAGIYALCPFMEEPWLERAYGDAYRSYKARTPRFF